MKKRVSLSIFVFVFAMLSIPAFFIMQSYGVFQKEKVLSDYALAIEVNGKSYATWPLINGYAAMDKAEENRQFYYRMDTSGLQNLFQLAYQEYEIEPNDTNPYLAGQINYSSDAMNYVQEEQQYLNANDFIPIVKVFNHDGQLIYTYEKTGKGDGKLVQSIIHQGMTRSNGNGSSKAARDPYLNITALFQDQLHMDVQLTVDEERKIVSIRINKPEARS
ncbi:hypothetical protein [Paenibacillus xylanexedens]|uniref:hypothetical protein n=1 Tax=Paenibacillus xylanexedens TaxID=528191 RepID=UPI00119D98ED|nr:hypothetical protein [Paenibacillus xylanexedens]